MKVAFAKNIQKNTDWNGCNKVVGNVNVNWELKYIPLSQRDRTPKQVIMDKDTLKLFIKDFSSIDQSKLSMVITTKEKEKKVAGTNNQQDDKMEKSENRISEIRKDEKDLTALCSGCSVKEEEEIFTEMVKLKDRLNLRKGLLTQVDLNNMVLTDLIDLISKIHIVICEKEKEEKKSLKQVPQIDQTYKSKKKNFIFVEGLVKFNLDSYEFASKNCKPSPFSFAYNLIKHCFPQSYYSNVSLGKKFYQLSDLTEMIEKKENYGKKFVLPFIWGFSDPFDEPFVGEFDLNLGLKRVQAFIGELKLKPSYR